MKVRSIIIFFKLFVLCFILINSSYAESAQCLNYYKPLIITPAQFETSAFGLVHAERPANKLYSEWSARTSNEILQLIKLNYPVDTWFEKGIQARQQFAREYEGFKNPEEDFGNRREIRAKNIVGEDMIGMSSITLKGSSAKDLGINFSEYPHEWWKNISENQDRKNLANQIIVKQILAANKIKFEEEDLDRDLLIIDRHYVTLQGEIIKSTSTMFRRVVPGDKESPYLVSTLNTPKPEIKLIENDVYNRLKQAIKMRNKSEALQMAVQAMNGFFSAMPYYRGSAAIGRIVFTAVFSQIVGKPVTIDPECDVKALLHDQFEYLRDIKSLLIGID